MVYLSGTTSAHYSLATVPLEARVHCNSSRQLCISLGTVHQLIAKMASEHTNRKTHPSVLNIKTPEEICLKKTRRRQTPSNMAARMWSPIPKLGRTHITETLLPHTNPAL